MSDVLSPLSSGVAIADQRDIDALRKRVDKLETCFVALWQTMGKDHQDAFTAIMKRIAEEKEAARNGT